MASAATDRVWLPPCCDTQQVPVSAPQQLTPPVPAPRASGTGSRGSRAAALPQASTAAPESPRRSHLFGSRQLRPGRGPRVPSRAAMFSEEPPPFWDKTALQDATRLRTGRDSATWDPSRPLLVLLPALGSAGRAGPSPQLPPRTGRAVPHSPPRSASAGGAAPGAPSPGPLSPWLGPRQAALGATDARRVWAAPQKRAPFLGPLYIARGGAVGSPRLAHWLCLSRRCKLLAALLGASASVSSALPIGTRRGVVERALLCAIGPQI